MSDILLSDPIARRTTVHYGSTGGAAQSSRYEPDVDIEDLGRREEQEEKNALSTFSGVFVPCILSIFGVILFERLGWVVGQAGLLLAMLILGSGYLVVTITALSLSAIATNGEMKGGGAYYMLSRSLGPAFGGSIGFIFYFANIAAGGTYVLGFVDAVIEMLQSQTQVELEEDSFYFSYWGEISYGTGAFFILFVICLVGAGAYAKAAIFIFIILWFSIISAAASFAFRSADEDIGFTSWSVDTLQGNTEPNFSDGETFQSIFAVFFPAVTGIMAGANMSGDLKDPGRSIPKGTLLAIAVSSVVYFALMVVVAATVQNYALLEDFFIMQNVCFYWPIVTVGIYASSLSSALGSLIGASRILQALGKDNLLPGLNMFAKGSGKADEPRLAVAVSWIAIQVTLFTGAVNTMASVTSMFFLLSYGAVNFACFALRIVGSPNFRPTFKYFNLWLSLAGSVMCIGGMFYVNAIYAAVSVILMIALYLFIVWRSVSVDWGDISQAMIYHQVRKYLLKMDVRKEHVKYWRPQILLVVDDPRGNVDLIQFVNNLKKGGLYVIGTTVVGDYRDAGELSLQFRDAWVEFIAAHNIKAFNEVIIAPTQRMGVHTLIMGAGIGVMKPNTVILGFFDDRTRRKGVVLSESQADSNRHANELFTELVERNNQQLLEHSMTPAEYVDAIREAAFFNKNVLIARNFASMDRDMIVSYRGSRILNHRQRMTVDMWPVMLTDGDQEYDSSFTLVLLLGYILKQTDIWTVYSKLRVKGVCVHPNDRAEEELRLTNLLKHSRIQSRVEVFDVVTSGSEAFARCVEEGRVAPDGSNFDALSLTERFAITNDVIRRQSNLTCAIFMTMPHVDCDPDPANYVHNLDVLTADLPPTMLVSGAEQVVTNEI